MGEVPCAGTYNDDELSACNEEGHHPEDAKGHEVHHFPGLRVPFHMLDLRTFPCGGDSSDGEHTYSSNEPGKEDCEIYEEEYYWHQDDPEGASNEVSSCLQDSYGDNKGSAHAHHSEEVKCGCEPNGQRQYL